MSADAGAPDAASQKSAARTGLLAALTAYTLWGMFPLYLKALSSVPAVEILAHRILWSAPFGALILTARHQWKDVFAALRSPRIVGALSIAALAIALNWLIYVWSVTHDRILEASLGYYINPLMYVAAGVFILGEKLRKLQIISVLMASAGVLALTLGVGVFPWVSFSLAILFTAYGYIRKVAPVGAMPGLFIEVSLLAPFALLYLFWITQSGDGAFLGGDGALDGLLVLAGPVTVIPLVMFAVAARRLSLIMLGFIQYIGPTLQFVLGLYYGEPFTFYHAICFTLIWLALIVFSADAWAEHRRKSG